MAVSAIKRKITAAPDAQTMMRVILENRDRFSDKHGQPLPFVQELSKYVAAEQEKFTKEGKNVSIEEMARMGNDERLKGHGVDIARYKDGTREQRLGRVKDDYINGDLIKDDAALLYRRIFPKMSIEAAEKDIGNMWEPEKKKAERKNKREEKKAEAEKKEAAEEKKENADGGKGKAEAAPSIEEQRNLIKEGVENGSIAAEYALRMLSDKNFAAYMPKAEAKKFLAENPAQHSEPEGGGIFDQAASDFEKIREKYKNAEAIEGDEDELYINGEEMPGRWKLVEADTPTASHDERTFHKTRGFPVTAEGTTINDRDYGHDKEAQEIVVEIGGNFDGRAVSVDNPVIVTKDGIVISGNNRTMSSKIAAKKGTDKKYIEALKKRAKKFGFTAAQIDKFKHPRVVFEAAENNGYSTEQFAKFNRSTKKAMSPIESAVKVAKTIKPSTVESIASKISDFETLGELYADNKATSGIFDSLQRDDIITAMDRPQYIIDGGITGAGKEFLETVLIGSVINESNIRGLNREGCKSIRQKLVRAITPLIENKGMNGYSITKELNEAVDIAMQVAINKKRFADVDDYTKQKKLFGVEDDPVAVELAKKLEGTQKSFAEFMQTMNGGLKPAANGEADIFLGGVESREDILANMLNLKKSIGRALEFFRNLNAGLGPRFVKKAVPVLKADGSTEREERWMQESIDGIAPYVMNADVSDAGTKVVAVDFDGVINSYTSGWQGPTETDEPVLSAAESLQTLFNRGYKVIIFSTRANTEEGVETIREYLRKLTENNELADTIEITAQKPIADVYIDDRAVPFTGDWRETLKQIEEFKPWTEQGPPISNEVINLPDGVYEGLQAAYTIKLNNGVAFPTITGIKCSWNNPVSCKVKIADGTPYCFMEKSLTYSGFPLQGRTKIHGMDISIENKKGSVRSGTDKDGHDWSIKMNYDYGYIRGTVGKDKDHVDCYIGPDPESGRVFVVHQNDPVTGEYDEDKVMLGFDSEDEARKAYASQYDRPGFLGSIDAMDLETFKEKAFDPKNKGKKLRAA
jgi:hypothetical protein